MKDTLALFPETYEASRERFRQNLSVIQERWGGAILSKQQITDDDLSIDWISADALERNEKVLIFTKNSASSTQSWLLPEAQPQRGAHPWS